MAGESVVGRMAIEIAANTAKFSKQLNGVDAEIKSFTSGIGKAAGIIGGLFAVKEVAGFAFEVSKLAGEADGVQAAFNKLSGSENLMLRLKQATSGTVTELDLMKRSVQASNFGISMEALPKLLEFAAVRAQQTGQSVDYLVDSIVTGIGRKSPLILDNLGISAVALRNEMNGVSVATAEIGTVAEAVGRIAEKNLSSMGRMADTTAVQTQQLSAAWDDAKVAIGRMINQTGILQAALSGVVKVANLVTDALDNTKVPDFRLLAQGMKENSETLRPLINMYRKVREEAGKPLATANIKELAKEYGLSSSQADRFYEIVRLINGETKKVTPIAPIVKPEQVQNLESLRETLKQLNEEYSQISIKDKQSLIQKRDEIHAIEKQIDAIESLLKVKKKDSDNTKVAGSIAYYREEIAKLNSELENVNETDLSRIRIISSQISGYDEQIKKIEDLKKSISSIDFSNIKPPDLGALLDPVAIEKRLSVVGGVELNMDVSLSKDMKQRFEKSMQDFQVNFASTIDKMKEGINSKAQQIGPQISSAMGSAFSGIGEALGGALAGTEKFGASILKVVANFAKSLGEILIATGVAMIAAEALISNPYTAIIAGVALVALATAASSAISKAHSSTIGGSKGNAASKASSGSKTNSNFSQYKAGEQIELTGEFELKGRNLVLAVDNENKARQRKG